MFSSCSVICRTRTGSTVPTTGPYLASWSSSHICRCGVHSELKDSLFTILAAAKVVSCHRLQNYLLAHLFYSSLPHPTATYQTVHSYIKTIQPPSHTQLYSLLNSLHFYPILSVKARTNDHFASVSLTPGNTTNSPTTSSISLQSTMGTLDNSKSRSTLFGDLL